ncbi:MAG: universal stress protein [Alphaproteobacteria bacterium]
MSIAVILAVIDGAPGSEAALKAAVRLGREFKARVELLHVEADAERSLPVMGEGMSGAAVEQVLQSLRAEGEARLAEARRLFEQYRTADKLPIVESDSDPVVGQFAVCFRHVTGRESEEVLHRARLSDLTVFGRSGREDGVTSTALEAVLFDSGRPLLLVPPTPVQNNGSTVAVAWDRSREAACAVHAAFPILRRAKRVVVITARQSESGVEPSELVHYLAMHGINARTWAFTPGSGTLGQEILEEASKAEAEMLVMGGYGHSRLRELVLGGATRSILSKAAIPVFMMH